MFLLPADDAQRWARRRLRPVMQSPDQWDQIRETLSIALAYPYTVAGRRLNLHRNTVTRRMNRAAGLLKVDFGTVSDAAVSLALELVSRSEPGDRARSDPALPAVLFRDERLGARSSAARAPGPAGLHHCRPVAQV
ncbi:helix-turn-helix domain-containing protein [Streptomyces sp. NPDC002402]